MAGFGLFVGVMWKLVMVVITGANVRAIKQEAVSIVAMATAFSVLVEMAGGEIYPLPPALQAVVLVGRAIGKVLIGAVSSAVV